MEISLVTITDISEYYSLCHLPEWQPGLSLSLSLFLSVSLGNSLTSNITSLQLFILQL